MVAAPFTKSRDGTDRPEAAQAGQVLAPGTPPWHGVGMEQQNGQKPHQASRASGALIAFTIIAGAMIGNHFGQPSIGVLAGIGLGVAIAVGLWLVDRKRG
jgi:hypothetical protein